LSVHAWVYGLHDGQVRDLGLDMSNPADLPAQYGEALANLGDAANARQP
jgi:carbonic anhydrase